MSAGSILILIPILFSALAVVGVVSLTVVLLRRPDPAPSEAAEAARRHASGVNATAWITLAALAVSGAYLIWPALDVLSDALGAAAYGIVPAVAGTSFLGVHAVGERTWPRPTGSIRRAALVARSAPDVAPVLLHGSPGPGPLPWSSP